MLLSLASVSAGLRDIAVAEIPWPGGLGHFVLHPTGWLPMAWHASAAIYCWLLLPLMKAFLRDIWAVLYCLSGMHSHR